jgi:hypothetical protein
MRTTGSPVTLDHLAGVVSDSHGELTGNIKLSGALVLTLERASFGRCVPVSHNTRGRFTWSRNWK